MHIRIGEDVYHVDIISKITHRDFKGRCCRDGMPLSRVTVFFKNNSPSALNLLVEFTNYGQFLYDWKNGIRSLFELFEISLADTLSDAQWVEIREREVEEAIEKERHEEMERAMKTSVPFPSDDKPEAGCDN